MGAGSHQIDPMAPLAVKEEGDFVFIDIDPRHLLKAVMGPQPILSHLHMREKYFPTLHVALPKLLPTHRGTVLKHF